jgi:acyl-coenzyme A thioesterase PaaI-like protein
MQPLPHTRSCFVCGEANPLGLKLRFETDGRFVHARFSPRPEHNGLKGVIHGGIIATVLDEIMVWACAVQTRRFVFCAEMKVRFLNPMRPGSDVTLTGELIANRKGRIFEAKGIAKDASGNTLAESTGKYLPVKGADVSQFAADFVGDASWLLGAVQPA